MKVVFAGHGLPIGPYAVITDRAWRADRAAALDACAGLGYPLFVKPARAGSSMGISKVEDRPTSKRPSSPPAHDPKVVVEAAIEGREIECAVLEGHGLDAAHLAGGRGRRPRQPRLLRLRGQVPRRGRRRPHLPC